MPLTLLAKRLGIHLSVLENYEEEYLHYQDKGFVYDEYAPSDTFEEFMCRAFADCAFLIMAQGGGTDMECLEAYDAAYTATEMRIND